MQRIPRSALKEAAVLGGTMVTTAVVVVQSYQIRMRNSKTYKRALEKVYNHEETVKLLGEPIKEGRITFRHHNTDNSRQFNVKLKGSNTKALLNCEFIINEDRKTEFTKLDIKYDNLPDKVFVIHQML
ncbi:uncharacterized protein LOC105663616 isoform X2 [Megachile rotundata]|uniref:uncharacterized protein LOC105663616 isoform X2 n=1 Tax=Megachile rotundata TaxID=143995 RepID=UPI000614AD9A|nr:PREDICTED: uncharacterized protein LOC105663616 isoform X2 [Megachile rotundata]